MRVLLDRGLRGVCVCVCVCVNACIESAMPFKPDAGVLFAACNTIYCMFGPAPLCQNPLNDQKNSKQTYKPPCTPPVGFLLELAAYSSVYTAR